MDAARSYLRWLFGTMLAASLAVAAFVLLVDPYGLYALADVPGINRLKPPVERYRNEIRLARAERVRPELVITGNSRMEAGVDPDGPALAGSGAFNLALAGTSMEMAIDQLRQLNRAGIAPRHIIAGAEFVDALTATPVRQVTLPQPLPAHEPGWRERLWQADALYSFASLRDALATVALQHDADGASATLRGHNPLRQYHRIAALEGYAALFGQRAAENTRKLAATADGGLDVAAVHGQLAALLDAAAAGRADVAVDVVIYPYHAQLLALFEQARLWPRFEAWKELLVTEAEAARRRHPRARIRVVDFSGFGPIQCEPIPAPGSRNATRWYWEAGHFKPALGDTMMARLLGSGGAAPAFGQPLDLHTLADNRARIAQERAACAARAPRLFDDVARQVAQARLRMAARS
ncbi:hypothetical protein IP92_04861 [Pseudoduganella flava]|uniref:SGNH/GDSL hydrolase family protein n=1 Tax=Pseudoduganella flava TaxID=871742 RepID=A0A562PH95_9BURK|nr:hypothetical protein [Pseudoduganella flava]QGZ42648.1 hypothetical protein GO485_28840 [Pseudoduganella flava]TWI43807.1 hypothetical protein IP92_04861 [Pseudoduganella flava]